MKLRRFIANGEPAGWSHYCPGCEGYHGIWVEQANRKGAKWTFDGNLEKPTFGPSIRCFTTLPDGTEQTLCHYFLQNGMLNYCGDSPHKLAGQSVPLPDWPGAPA